jgi:small-conductance mechanosensitive channel
VNQLLGFLRSDLFNPKTLIGALFWGGLFLLAATVVAALSRRLARRLEQRLSDTTGLGFVNAFTQVLAYLVAFIVYAHLIPELRALGTSLLAGVSVISVVVGLAAQSTLSNLVAGISLVLYRPFRVGDSIQLNSPKGVITARVRIVSLGHTALEDEEGNEVVVPNSVMASSVVVKLRGKRPSPPPSGG